MQFDILPMWERTEVMGRWTEYRLDTLVTELMRRERNDMWVPIAYEYYGDFVLLMTFQAGDCSFRLPNYSVPFIGWRKRSRL